MKKSTLNLIYALVAVIVAAFVIYRLFISKPDLTSSDILPDKFEEVSKQNGVAILDVRSTFEFRGEKIKGAQNISYSGGDFQNTVQTLDKEKTYLVYCQTGSRSAGAVKLMKELGFKNVYNLIGGFEKWKRTGKLVIR
jgi:rhodanese-related sulfurtransferase